MKPARCLGLLATLAIACTHESRPASSPVDAHAPPHAAIDAAADVTHDAPADVPRDVAPPPVLTIRITNGGTTPLHLLSNPDTNEIVHTRKLRDHPMLDASLAMRDGELVKFFPVGREPFCDSDAGAGYGGLGQPEPITLAPGEHLDFAWDGVLRREVLGPLGVCQQAGTPDPGRYRFEVDQPYNPPSCRAPYIAWPLAPTQSRLIEIRCVARPGPPH